MTRDQWQEEELYFHPFLLPRLIVSQARKLDILAHLLILMLPVQCLRLL